MRGGVRPLHAQGRPPHDAAADTLTRLVRVYLDYDGCYDAFVGLSPLRCVYDNVINRRL